MKKRNFVPIVATAVVALSAAADAMAWTTIPSSHAQDPQREAMIRAQFGPDVLIDARGNITKRYDLATESRRALGMLLTPIVKTELTIPRPGARFGGPEPKTVLGRMLGDKNWLELVYFEDFHRDPSPRTDTEKDSTHALLLVTADAGALAAFEAALNLMCAMSPQVEVEVQIIEYGKTSSRSSGAARGDAEASTVKDRSAMADITTSQKLVVRDGGVATIATHESQPIPEPGAKDQADTTTKLRFRDIGTTVKVRAEIVGTDGVVLDLEIRNTTVVGFAPTAPLPTPILATRELTTSVQGKSRHTLVIGGRKEDARLTSSRTNPDGDTPTREGGSDPGQSPSDGGTKDKDSESAVEIHITPRIVRDRGLPR